MTILFQTLPSEILPRIAKEGLTVSDYSSLQRTSRWMSQHMGRLLDKVTYNLLHNIWRQQVFSIPPQHFPGTISRLLCTPEISRFSYLDPNGPGGTALDIDIQTRTAVQKTQSSPFKGEKRHGQHSLSAITWSVRVRSFLSSDSSYLPGLWRDFTTNDKLVALLDNHQGKLAIYSHERGSPPKQRATYPQIQGTALSFNNEGDKLIVVAPPHLFRRNWHVTVLELNTDQPTISLRDSKGLYYVRDALAVIGSALCFTFKKIATFIFTFFVTGIGVIIMAAPQVMKITIAATLLTVLTQLFVANLTIKLIVTTFLTYGLLFFGIAGFIGLLAGLGFGLKSLLT